MTRATPQIGCYLLKQEADGLTAYARSLELSRPRLCALLVIRAGRSGTLPALPNRFPTTERKTVGTRVTARIESNESRRLFLAAAAQLGLGSGDAAGHFPSPLDERGVTAYRETGILTGRRRLTQQGIFKQYEHVQSR